MASEDMMNLPANVLAQIAQQYVNGDTNHIKASNGASSSFAQDTSGRQSLGQGEGGPPRYTISEESWKHHAQARAILGNLIGPNGEQLTSTDPYNTTVFVGGLSPLISEETLRTFFAPFGDIHYVCSRYAICSISNKFLVGQGPSGQTLRVRAVCSQG